MKLFFEVKLLSLILVSGYFEILKLYLMKLKMRKKNNRLMKIHLLKLNVCKFLQHKLHIILTYVNSYQMRLSMTFLLLEWNNFDGTVLSIINQIVRQFVHFHQEMSEYFLGWIYIWETYTFK